MILALLTIAGCTVITLAIGRLIGAWPCKDCKV